MKNLILLIISVLVLSLTSCQTTSTQRGAMLGGALGAAAGQIIGGDSESTLLGAGAGALGGALFNDRQDQQNNRSYEQGRQDGYRDSQQNHNTAPRKTSYNNRGNHSNNYNTSVSAYVNGQPVLSREQLQIMERTASISMRQQQLDHRQEMDRTWQKQRRYDQYGYIVNNIGRQVLRNKYGYSRY